MSVTGILAGLGDAALGVIQALVPLTMLFVVFQLMFLKLPRSYVFNLLKGTLLAAVGLLLFLQGVRMAFLPVGQIIGETLATVRTKWLLIPAGLVTGYLTAWAEPAVRVLSEQVETSSGGSVRKYVVLNAICSGVALFVALGMVKIALGVPLLWIIVPGYAIAIVMLWLSDAEFLAIAFDAGGVATGPLSTAFLVAIALGMASSTEGRDAMIHGFGLIGLIALAPVLSVMALGLYIRLKERGKE